MQLSLLLVAVAMTIVFLVLVRATVERELNRSLAEDTRRSEVTFANLQTQRRHLLERTAALMGDLPSLKALMTAGNVLTVADGGVEFWRLSGGSLFALSDRNGHVVSFYHDGPPLTEDTVQSAVTEGIARPGAPYLLASHQRLMDVLSQPIEFGRGDTGFRLGYVTVGYALDREMAQEVGQAASAQVAFLAGGEVVASTLRPALNAQLGNFGGAHGERFTGDLWLGKERFVASRIPLASGPATNGQPYLLVLKSYEPARRTMRQLNWGIAAIGLFGLLTGSVLAAAMARTVTGPLESLLEGTRALGAGDFRYELRESGALEVRGLSFSFRRMQAEIERTQGELLVAERMATIGRMASSISHDLRHYLTSMYANAEFLSMANSTTAAREEMLDEVKTAVVGMTDLLDSLLVFGRTGMALQRRLVDPVEVIDRAVLRVKGHPDARGVHICWQKQKATAILADPQELDRAIYNLVLNACQAVRRCSSDPLVTIRASSDGNDLSIAIEDNGPGVSESIRSTLFQPFVSEGKEHGTGLGLALSARITEAHGGRLWLESSHAGQTIFCLSLPLKPVESDKASQKYIEGIA